SLYLAFILAAFIFFYKQRLVVTAIFCALTTLIRPEGILVPITLTIVTLWGTSDYRIKIRQLGAPIIVFTLITLPWIFFAWFYFGSVVPQPLVAKSDLGVSGV